MSTVDVSVADPPGMAVTEDQSELPPGPVEGLGLAYFHGTHRCSGRIRAEEFTRETLEATGSAVPP